MSHQPVSTPTSSGSSVIPGVIGPFLAGRLALTVWMLMLGALGLALVRSTQTGVS